MMHKIAPLLLILYTGQCGERLEQLEILVMPAHSDTIVAPGKTVVIATIPYQDPGLTHPPGQARDLGIEENIVGFAPTTFIPNAWSSFIKKVLSAWMRARACRIY